MSEPDRRHLPWGDPEADIAGLFKQIQVTRNFTMTNVDLAEELLRNVAGLKDDEHGLRTPERFVKMLSDLTTPQDFEFTSFPSEDMHDMIIVEKIPFVSMCNHHVVPFVGYAHIAYVPDQNMAGLSKFARCVKYYAASLQVQERLTTQIANRIELALNPLGVGVVLKAEHMCMTIRGVQTPGTKTTTSTMRGVFADHERTAKSEFLQFLSMTSHE